MVAKSPVGNYMKLCKQDQTMGLQRNTVVYIYIYMVVKSPSWLKAAGHPIISPSFCPTSRRKKYPRADGKLNFAAQVSAALLNETEDHKMNVA